MHKGIHARGYLPHWDFADSVQAITFRLGDALPNKVVMKWRNELAALMAHPDPKIAGKAHAELHGRIARYEDAGYGACVLAEPRCAGIVQEMLQAKHGDSYKLIDWCIMPNHVHALIRLLNDTSLSAVVKAWKAPSAIRINRLLGRTGSLWLEDYHDRFIRDLDHFYNAVAYIRNNPVKAGLCRQPSDWAFSSAGCGWDKEGKEEAE
jgi:REP element-mobilizing transposase RayT